jgi:peptide methionine sulfoxide reductase msrA/msrB
MKKCCSSKTSDKECVRKSDGKVFELPRRFTKKRCKKRINGFTMRSSCAPYKDCLTKKVKRQKVKRLNTKGGELPYKKNILGEQIKVCSKKPMTGFYRDGYCMTGPDDSGTHTVCAKMDKKFLDYTKNKGNDLSSVVESGDKWCLCEYRWQEAFQDGVGPKVKQDATNMRTKDVIRKQIKTQTKTKTQTKARPVFKVAYFAGGCFWGLQKSFNDVLGVNETTVGYMDSKRSKHNKSITYEYVSTGKTGYTETVKVKYNSTVLPFVELVELFFSFHDPTTLNRQGNDVGTQYRSIAFYSNKSEKSVIDKFIKNSDKKFVTEVKKKTTFRVAEDYHQNYLQKKECVNPNTENLEVFHSICKGNTTLAEPQFSGKYVKKPYVDGQIDGIYVCPCCSNHLYSSKDAFDSNSGWPAFSNTIDKKGLSESKHIIFNEESKELNCKACGLHLGHRTIEGKKIHDCINSTCIHFIAGKNKDGGSRGGSKSRNVKKTEKRLLPQLREIDKSKKEHVYKLSDPHKKRVLAIDEGIRDEMRKGVSRRDAVLSKKKRFNILRLYRKNNDPNGCKRLTQDMKYMDKKYETGQTNNICK